MAKLSITESKEETLHLMRELESSPEITQRTLSTKLGISLGKTNYLLKEMIKKGFIKVMDFSQSKYKIQRVRYYLTKKGIDEKLELTYKFLKRKEAEYHTIKEEWERLTTDKKSPKV
ncbi:MAG: MarR family EPS-associated transcriptional regulator [Candidatus Omnitrophica bacterium]|nr:MarR family EPS-associated transcriptional regulator [Candidatus Omnitrophota bacterium]